MAKPKFFPAKGVRDWHGKNAIARAKVRDTLTKIFELYGYDRLETPLFERLNTVQFKGGGEIQKEVYQVQDRGNNGLALRFDQTVPLARFLSTFQNTVRIPFKRYAIGEVFRDGPVNPGQGRYRIFTQCDADIVGVPDMTAEAELLALAQRAFGELGLGDIEVNINNRKVLEGIMDIAEVPLNARLRTISTLDKMDKIGLNGVKNQLYELSFFDEPKVLSNNILTDLYGGIKEEGLPSLGDEDMKTRLVSEIGSSGYEYLKRSLHSLPGSDEVFSFLDTFRYSGERLLTDSSVSKILDLVSVEGSNQQKVSLLEKALKSPISAEGLREVSQIFDYANSMGFSSVVFNPSLARGLDYYTGTTIEVFLKNKDILSSAILAGGRFDDMIGDYRGQGEKIPAVGFSFGLERLASLIKRNSEIPSTRRQLYLIPIGQENILSTLKIAEDMRDQGIRTDINLQGVSAKKAVDYANKSGIPYVGFIGENELAQGAVMVKDLATGTQTSVPVSAVYNTLFRDD